MTTQYSHPHDTITVNDNSGYVEVAEQLNNSDPVLFQAFFSGQGEDNKIFTCSDYDKLVAEYGYPDINLYGQSYYQAAQWLKGGGIVKGIRVTANNAVKANTVVLLNIKTVDSDVQKTDTLGNLVYYVSAEDKTEIVATDETYNADTAVPVMLKKAVVSFETKSFTDDLNLTSINDVKAQIKSLLEENEEEGTYKIPLFLVVSKGRGAYGNSFRIRLTNNLTRDKETNYRNYNFELLINSGSGLIKNFNTVVSSYTSAKNLANRSMYIEDVINSSDVGIKLYGMDDAWSKVTSILLPLIQQETQFADITATDVDFLGFKSLKAVPYKYVELSEDSVIDLTAVEGIGLVSGSDGNFAETNGDRFDEMYSRLEELFEGKIDPSILDINEHMFKVALDANYPIEVKKKMVTWRKNRDDFNLVLDACDTNTIALLKDYLENKLSIGNDYGVLVNTQSFDTYDSYTGRNITVTTNWLYATLLANHIKTSGTHVPFAGIDIPLNSYIIEGSLKPVFSNDQDKNDIYELRGNYIQKENGYYVFGSNVTHQEKLTDLTYFNNSLTLYEMKAIVRSLGSQFRFKFNDSADQITLFNKIANQALESYQGVKCKVCKVEVTKSEDDYLGKTIRTVLKVGFRDFNLNNEVEIDVERY